MKGMGMQVPGAESDMAQVLLCAVTPREGARLPAGHAAPHLLQEWL